MKLDKEIIDEILEIDYVKNAAEKAEKVDTKIGKIMARVELGKKFHLAAVGLLKDKGWSTKEIADALDVGEDYLRYLMFKNNIK